MQVTEAFQWGQDETFEVAMPQSSLGLLARATVTMETAGQLSPSQRLKLTKLKASHRTASWPSPPAQPGHRASELALLDTGIPANPAGSLPLVLLPQLHAEASLRLP